MESLRDEIHKNYWDKDLNCATNMLVVLAKVFDIELHRQVLHSSLGMHGAGQYGGQCGLLEGALMFLGVYGREKNLSNKEIVRHCNTFAKKFEGKYDSLTCKTIRPKGFSQFDKPHLCEDITNEMLVFSKNYIERYL